MHLFCCYLPLMLRTPKEIIDFIGLDQAAKSLGVAPTRVQRARFLPRLPALWYDCFERLAGRPLPRDAFAFKRSEDEMPEK